MAGGSVPGIEATRVVVEGLDACLRDGREVAVEAVRDLLAPDVTWQGALGEVQGVAAVVAAWNGRLRSLGHPPRTGAEWRFGDGFAVGTYVLHGKNVGSFMGSTGTHLPLTVPVLEVVYLREGRVARVRTVDDVPRVIAQLSSVRLAARRARARG